MSHSPPRKSSLTCLAQSTLGLSLLPGQEGEAPLPHPQPAPPELDPQQGPEKEVDAVAEKGQSKTLDVNPNLRT